MQSLNLHTITLQLCRWLRSCSCFANIKPESALATAAVSTSVGVSGPSAGEFIKSSAIGCAQGMLGEAAHAAILSLVVGAQLEVGMADLAGGCATGAASGFVSTYSSPGGALIDGSGSAKNLYEDYYEYMVK